LFKGLQGYFSAENKKYKLFKKSSRPS